MPASTHLWFMWQAGTGGRRGIEGRLRCPQPALLRARSARVAAAAAAPRLRCVLAALLTSFLCCACWLRCWQAPQVQHVHISALVELI